MVSEDNKWWQEYFTPRELQLIWNCRDYVDNDPAGLPGHNLMVIIAKMKRLLCDEGIAPDYGKSKAVP